jgi:acetyl-CoA C-acetyltransferase
MAVVITHAKRTPIGKFLGSLSAMSAADLGVEITRALLASARLDPARADQLIFGNARQAGGGPNMARQVSVRAGLGHEKPAFTVNMACASGLKAIALAQAAIERGDAQIVVAGGAESMSRVPFLIPDMRLGLRLGNRPLIDGMYRDGFDCPLAGVPMGRTAETLAERYSIPRDEQDRYALESQLRAERARKEGRFQDELISFEAPLPDKPGKKAMFTQDEHPRDGATLESIAKLPPVFKEGGTVHAGNSSGITDGAAAVLMMSDRTAAELGFTPLARIVGYAEAGVDPAIMGIGPVPATSNLLGKLNLRLADLDLVELNEAFAAQVLACLRDLPIPRDRLNVNGGAIALGHPIGATGCRIVVTLLHEMRRRQARRGLATLCVSGGMGVSMLFER